jgi:amino acid permease
VVLPTLVLEYHLPVVYSLAIASMSEIHEMKVPGVVSRPEDYSLGDGHPVNSNGGEKSFVTRDDKEMAYLGKKQQLKRNFGFMSMVGFSCTLMITWEGMLCVFVYGLEDGGPAGLVYGFLLCWFGYFTVVASLAELIAL